MSLESAFKVAKNFFHFADNDKKLVSLSTAINKKSLWLACLSLFKKKFIGKLQKELS